MTGRNVLKDQMGHDNLEYKVRIFTSNKKPAAKTLLNRYAMIFMDGFNNAPWDIYEFNFTPEKAIREFTESVSTAINSNGALISVEQRRTPAGFSIVTGLDSFSQDLKKAAGYKRPPRDYKSPTRYFKKLAQITGVPEDEFGKIGYIEEVAVDSKFQGKGYGNILIQSSIKYLNDQGKKYILAWTVNPIMARILSGEGFKHIKGIGDKGEGIDCLVDNGIWFPTLVIPPRQRSKQSTRSAAARHYFKEI